MKGRIGKGCMLISCAIVLVAACKQEKPLVGLTVTKNDVAQWGGTTNMVAQSKMDGDIEMTVYEGGAAMRGQRPGMGEERGNVDTHKRIVRAKEGKIVEVTVVFDARAVKEDDDVYNAFFILANGMAKQVGKVDLAKNDEAFEKLGLADPTAEGRSTFKVSDDVMLVRRVAAGSLKFTAVVPGYSERS